MTLLQAAQYYQEEYGIKESTDEIIDGIYKGIERYYFDEVILKDGVADFCKSFIAIILKCVLQQRQIGILLRRLLSV